CMTVTAAMTLSVHADDAGDKPTKPPAAKSDASKPAQGSALDRFEANVRSLKLTDEQKPKIDKYFEAARKEMNALSDDTDAKDREQKTKDISTKLRNEIGEVLTNEQKAELVKKMPPPVDTDTMIDRIKKDLNKPGSKLTAEQKTKIDAVLDDTKKKLNDLRNEARETKTDPRAKVQEVLADMKQKLG